jgi:hypothetical protein
MLTPGGRKLKQTNVALGFLTFLLGIAALIWFFVAAPAPTEEIKSLEIEEISAEFQAGEQSWNPPFTYIASAKLRNPNENFFAKKVDFKFEIKDESGKVLSQEKGTTELKANEEKEIQKEISINNKGQDLSFQITNVEWAKGE